MSSGRSTSCWSAPTPPGTSGSPATIASTPASGATPQRTWSGGAGTIGIDAWGLDRAFDVMAGEVLRGEEGVEFWETHLYGLEEEYVQIEKLANLDKLPVSHGFTVMAFPCKIRGPSAGWSRVVALVEMEG